jgi:hypothetical protein
MLSWFITPVQVTGWQELALLVPLCLAVAIVRRVTRIENIREAVAEIAITWAVYVAGMVALGIGLYVLHTVMA